jgi:hypothetical protein
MFVLVVRSFPALCLEDRATASLDDESQGTPRSWYRRTTFWSWYRKSSYQRHPPPPHPRPRHPSKKPSVCSTVFETCACAQVPWCTLSIEFNVLESGWHWCPRGAERSVRQWTFVVYGLWRWVLEFRQPRRLKTRRTTGQVPRSLMNVTSQTLPPMYKTIHFFGAFF